MPEPRTEKEVHGFLGRLNYIARFISHLTTMCEPIFKLLRKDQVVKWNDNCKAEFDKIKEYLQEPPILLPPVEGRPLIMYLTVLENSMGYVLGQNNEMGRKEYAIYYLSNKFTMRVEVLIAGKDLLCTCVGSKASQIVYVDLHYSLDIQDRSNQPNFRKANSHRKSSPLTDDFNRI